MSPRTPRTPPAPPSPPDAHTPNAPGVLADELLAIYTRDGAITPEAVVLAARSPESPLHHRFEWDDTAAAEAHRRTQAKSLIREIKVQLIRNPETPPVYVRAFVHLPALSPEEAANLTDENEDAESTGAYYPYEVVASSQLLSRIALREMERRWHQLRRAYENHSEFWTIVQKDLAKNQRKTG